MRKYQQKQILELVKTLDEVHTEIKRLHSRGESASIIQLLADCQDFATHVGNYIEQLEGEGTRTVSYLEEYCQLLYQASLEINNADIKDNFVKRLQKQVIKVENNIMDELKPNKVEILFLPYKASMWDSLESIWLAAKDDPQCDAYVVAIPYCDRLPGGAFGQMHYEGGQYPDYVPIVDWRTYDIEERHPDVIFIHNPYDDGNYVTSIHPDFYSGRLKGFTDLLCYSPYFVSTTETGEHFVTTPAVLNADKIFLQSVSTKDQYISVFTDFEKKNNCKNRFGKAKDKFVALGSPKFDVVINAEREDFTLPDEWVKQLEKPDGSRKKVILYNTSINALLNNTGQYLKKLRSVIELFHGRDDVILWWRPHPLLESTIVSMRPEFLDEYKRIIADYKSEGRGIYIEHECNEKENKPWGIYDDSTDVNRAVTYADYYYGDSGSAVEAVFFATGKPIMIQNINVLGDTPVAPIILGADDSRLFFSPLYSSAIMSFDLVTNEIKVVRSGYSTVKRPYALGVKLDDILYFTPSAEESVLMLDTKADKFTDIPFEAKKSYLLRINPKYRTGSNFGMSYECSGKIFFVGCYYPAIMRYNPDDGLIEYRTEWPNTFKSGDNGTVFAWSCQMGSKIVMVGATSVILYFDVETNQFSTENISHKSATSGFSTVAYGDHYLWLMSKEDGTILKFNPENKKVIEYNEFPIGVNRCESMCSSSIFASGYLWLFSNNTNAVLRVKAESGEISVVRLFSNPTRGNAVHLGLPILVGNKIYASLLNYRGLTVYDVDTGTYTEISTNVAPNTDSIEYEATDIRDTIMLENGFDNIDTLINTPVRNNEKLLADWISSPDGTAGEKIYNYVKGLVIPK